MKFAVIFAGCGFLDGTEIREAVLTLLELENNKIDYEVFAPNINQHHVVNHLTQQPTQEVRNVLIESARIARGKIKDLSELKCQNFSSLIITGGFGVAKNLSNLAYSGPTGQVLQLIKEAIASCHSQKKPIGAICIAPAVVAMTLFDKNPSLTLGLYSNLLDEIGVKNQPCSTDEIVFDPQNLLVSTPAYMHETDSLSNIHSGIKKLIIKLKEISQ